MNPAIIIKDIISKLSHKQAKLKCSLHLFILSVLSEFQREDNKFEKLMEGFIDYALAISHPARGLWIAGPNWLRQPIEFLAFPKFLKSF
jgi:hypothetical protein